MYYSLFHANAIIRFFSLCPEYHYYILNFSQDRRGHLKPPHAPPTLVLANIKCVAADNMSGAAYILYRAAIILTVVTNIYGWGQYFEVKIRGPNQGLGPIPASIK